MRSIIQGWPVRTKKMGGDIQGKGGIEINQLCLRTNRMKTTPNIKGAVNKMNHFETVTQAARLRSSPP